MKLESLFRQFLKFSECLTANDIYQKVLEDIKIFLNCKFVSIFKVEGESSCLKYVDGEIGKRSKTLLFKDTLLGYCVRELKIVNIKNAEADKRVIKGVDW